MLTFDSDNKVENIINNCFSAACTAVYDLFPEKLRGGSTKSSIDKLQQRKKINSEKITKLFQSISYKKYYLIRLLHLHHQYRM